MMAQQRLGRFRSPPWQQLIYWALDLETGGFDAQRDPILSVGMAPIRAAVIYAGDAYQSFVKPTQAILQSSLQIYHILPEGLAQASGLAEVLTQIVARLREDVLLAHYAQTEVAFLKHACRQQQIAWPMVRVVDSMKLILRLQHNQRFYSPTASNLLTNLALARAHFVLPA